MMSRTAFITVAFSIITISKSNPVVQRKSTMPNSNDQKTLKSINENSKAIGSKMVELALDQFLPTNSFTLTITNNMVSRRLIDPRIYIDNGHTVNPPPFMISAPTEPFGGARQIALLENDPAGVLCYGNEANVEQRQRQPIDTCVVFRAGKKYYAVYSQNGKMTSAEMKKLYSDFTNNRVTRITPTKNTYGGFVFTDYKLFQVLAQMTSGKENLQLHFEVFDTVSSAQEVLQKRVVTAALSGLAMGGLSSLASFAFNRITADVGTTLTLENGATENLPLNLIDPRWEQNGVELYDIVPWRIGPKETSEITLVGPLGAGKTFQRSAIALSFNIQGTNDRIVFTIWWPMKANFISKEFNSYSVSWLTIPKSRRNSDDLLTGSLKNLVKQADSPESFPTPVIAVDVFQQYWIWQFPISNPINGRIEKFLNVLTMMGDGRKNGLTVKLYATEPGRYPSRQIRPPKVYTGLPNEIPPT